MKLITFFLIVIFSSISFAQVVKGKIVDEKNQPLPGANIYFDGTSIATIADKEGEFQLQYGSKLNSVLAVSFVGYQTQYIQNPKIDVVFNVILVESKNIINEVVVKKDQFSRKQKLQLFKEQFIGRTANSKNVFILNEDDIYFDYDEKTLTLKAFSDSPLKIVNNALGYNITYELVNFEVIFFQNSMKSSNVLRSFYSGLSRFEEVSNDIKKLKKREKCFKGSQLHFFRNLSNNVWNKENFLLFKGQFQDNPSDYFTIISEGDSKQVNIKQQSKELVVNNFVADFNLLFNKKQQSRITFETNTFYVDKFGNNSNIENIIFTGYLSELKVADMLPLNYGIE